MQVNGHAAHRLSSSSFMSFKTEHRSTNAARSRSAAFLIVYAVLRSRKDRPIFGDVPVVASFIRRRLAKSEDQQHGARHLVNLQMVREGQRYFRMWGGKLAVGENSRAGEDYLAVGKNAA